MAAPLRIGIRLAPLAGELVDREQVVVVEPLYGGVAVAAALDAGWASVELAGEGDGPPIPLVSFEQPPPPGLEDPRCRVRCDLLRDVVYACLGPHGAGGPSSRPLLVGCIAHARPLAAALAAAAADPDLAQVTLVPAPAPAVHGQAQPLAVDAAWACGVLVRILLEELDERPVELDDAAGLAVTLARGAEDAAVQLAAGARWRRHLERGGHRDDLRVAAAIDTIGSVPQVVVDGGAVVAVPVAARYSGS